MLSAVQIDMAISPISSHRIIYSALLATIIASGTQVQALTFLLVTYAGNDDASPLTFSRSLAIATPDQVRPYVQDLPNLQGAIRLQDS